MNIQDYKDAQQLCPYRELSSNGDTDHYIYYVPSSGILYDVLADSGTIIGQKYALDIAFGCIPGIDE